MLDVTLGLRTRTGVCHALVLMLIAAPVLMVGSCRADTGVQAIDPADTVSQMREDIALLATINRLSLSQNQATQLLALARGAQEAQAALDEPRRAALQKLMPLLEQQMSHMIHDQQVPAELGDQICAAEEALQAIETQRAEAALPYAVQAGELLTQPQLQILTGGDEALRAAEEMLVWVRELPDADFTSEARANADALADPEIGLDSDAIFAVLSQARALTPDEYVNGMASLAAKLAPLYASGDEGEDMMIADLLTNPRFLPLMQRRLQYLSAGGEDG